MTCFNELPKTVNALWAKTLDKKSYSILCHMLDVAAVAEVILDKESPSTIKWVANKFGLSEAVSIRWIAAMVGLHDFGKATPGFQSKNTKVEPHVKNLGLFFPFDPKDGSHDSVLFKVLSQIMNHDSQIMKHERKYNRRWMKALLLSLSAHHGYFLSSSKHIEPHSDLLWNNARIDLFNAYWNSLAPEGEVPETKIDTPSALWFAGLTSIADWIGSNIEEWFPIENGPRADTLLKHFETSKILARKALQDISWKDFQILLKENISHDDCLGMILDKEQPTALNNLQSIGMELLQKTVGPTLMIVEAPMGHGKTELAFMSYLHLQKKNCHRGMYLAMPTQATSNAIFDRMLQFLKGFNAESTFDIQLIHAGAMMNDRVRSIRDKSETTATS